MLSRCVLGNVTILLAAGRSWESYKSLSGCPWWWLFSLLSRYSFRCLWFIFAIEMVFTFCQFKCQNENWNDMSRHPESLKMIWRTIIMFGPFGRKGFVVVLKAKLLPWQISLQGQDSSVSSLVSTVPKFWSPLNELILCHWRGCLC